MNAPNAYGLTAISPNVALADGSFVAESPDYSRLGRSVSMPDGSMAVEIEGIRGIDGKEVDEAKVQAVAVVTPEKDAWQVSFGSGDRKEGNILERLAARTEAAIENAFSSMEKRNVPDAVGSVADRAASVRQGFVSPDHVLGDSRGILMRAALLDRENAGEYKNAAIDLRSGKWQDAETRLSRAGAITDKEVVAEQVLTSIHGARSMDEVNERLKVRGLELIAGDKDWTSVRTAAGQTFALEKPSKDQPKGLALVDDISAARTAWAAGKQADTEQAVVDRGLKGPLAGRKWSGWGQDVDPETARALDRERGQGQAYEAIIASLTKEEAGHLLIARTEIMRSRMNAGRSDTAISVTEMSDHLVAKDASLRAQGKEGISFGTVRSNDGTRTKSLTFAEKLGNTEPPDEAKTAMRRWMSATVSDTIKDLVERGMPGPSAATSVTEVRRTDDGDQPSISGGRPDGRARGYREEAGQSKPSEAAIRQALAKHGISMVKDTDRNGGWKFSASAQGVGHFSESAKDLGFDPREDPSLSLDALMAAGDRAGHARKSQAAMLKYMEKNGAGTVQWDSLNKQLSADGMRIQVMGARTYVTDDGRIGIARRLGIADERTGIAMPMDEMGMGDATLHEVGKVQKNYDTKPFTDNLKSEWNKFVGLFETQLFGYHRSAPRHAAPERTEARHRPERVTWDEGASAQRSGQSRGR